MSKQERANLAQSEQPVETIHCRLLTDPERNETAFCVGNEYCSSLVKQGLVLNRNGGITIAIIKNKDTGEYHAGISVCSERDAFDRKKGAMIARGRASKANELGQVLYGPKTRHGYTEALLEYVNARIEIIKQSATGGVRV